MIIKIMSMQLAITMQTMSALVAWLMMRWLCRVLKAAKERLESTAAEREASRNIKIEGTGDVPQTMQVKQSPVAAKGNGKE